MIRVLEHDAHSKLVKEVSYQHMNYHHVKWANFHEPTDQELRTLSGLIKISYEDLVKCLDTDERPTVTELNHFSVVIFKAPYLHKRSVTNSFYCLISKNLIITISKNKIDAIEHLFEMALQNKIKVLDGGTTHTLYKILDAVQDAYYKILDELEDEISSIENHIFQGKQATLKKIFHSKKVFLYFQKGLSANRDVIVHIEKHNLGDHINIRHMKHFRYLYDDCVQLLDMITTYRDLLASNMEMHLSAVSNNLNQTVKKMTAFGSLILIPTLIAGIYGMNFQYTPEFAWEYGYAFAWGVMVLSVILIGWYFKKKEYF